MWAGPCRGLCLSPSFDMRLIMVRRGNTALLTSLSIFSLLRPRPPLPRQNVTPPPNGENRWKARSPQAVCGVQIPPADSSSLDGCRRGGRGPDTLKLGTLVAARHFCRQPTDMTGEASGGLSGPSRSDRWRRRAQAIMMDWEGRKDGGRDGC